MVARCATTWQNQIWGNSHESLHFKNCLVTLEKRETDLAGMRSFPADVKVNLRGSLFPIWVCENLSALSSHVFALTPRPYLALPVLVALRF